MSKEKSEKPQHHVFKAHGDLKLAEHERCVHFLWVPSGVTLEQATDVRSFAHIANDLRVNGEIIIRSEDDAFYARVLIRAIRNLDVVVSVLDYVDLKGVMAVPVDSEFEVKYINGRYKWGFKRRGADDWIIKEIDTEQQAHAALADHRKAIAA